MRKVIAAFNMTLDGACDHTTGIADEELHHHYADLIDSAGVLLYGRATFQLMQYWQELLEKPSNNTTMNDFAIAIDRIPKIVFSYSLKDTGWHSATLSNKPLDEKVLELKEQHGKNILVGSRSLIIQLLNNSCIDELQICLHPSIVGKGLRLFDQITRRIELTLVDTKPLTSSAAVLCYEPRKQ